VNQHYKIGEKLGEGGFGAVYKVQCKRTKERYALKSVHIQEDKGSGDVEAEIASSCEFDHPYLLKLHAFFREGRTYHLVMDLCTGGDLCQYIKNYVSATRQFDRSFRGGLPTKMAARFLWQMLNGLTFLHHHGFVHRDIKPDNYLLLNQSDNSPLKLADFGFACQLARAEKLTRAVGTPCYAAPEVLNALPYDQKADVWSLGVTSHGMCTDVLPFDHPDEDEYIQNVKMGRFSEAEENWKRQKPEMRALVMSMLTLDPATRPSSKKLLADNPWLRSFGKPAGMQGCCVVS